MVVLEQIWSGAGAEIEHVLSSGWSKLLVLPEKEHSGAGAHLEWYRNRNRACFD